MKNNSCNIDALFGTISGACPLEALHDLVDDLDLEFVSCCRA